MKSIFAAVLSFFLICVLHAAMADRFHEPSQFNRIGDYAYQGTTLSGVASFFSVKNIGVGAFAGTHLDTVIFGGQIQSVGANAFETVQNVYIVGRNAQLNPDAFGSNVKSICGYGANSSVQALRSRYPSANFIDLDENKQNNEFSYETYVDEWWDDHDVQHTEICIRLIAYIGEPMQDIIIPERIAGHKVNDANIDFFRSLATVRSVTCDKDSFFEEILVPWLWKAFGFVPELRLSSPNYFTENGFLYHIVNSGKKTVEMLEYYANGDTATVPAKSGGYRIVSIGGRLEAFGGHPRFNSAYPVRKVALPEGPSTISMMAFSGLSIKELSIPASVTQLGGADPAYYTQGPDDDGFESILWRCDALERIEVAPGNQKFKSEDGVLFTKDGKKLLHYPSARAGEIYEVPEGVTYINPIAFSYTKNLKRIILPASLKRIPFTPDAIFGASSWGVPGTVLFEGCKGLEAISVHPDNTVYSSADGVLYTKDGKVLIRYPDFRSSAEYIVPEGTERILSGAFFSPENLKELTLSESTCKIGFLSNFYGHSQLIKIFYSQSVEIDWDYNDTMDGYPCTTPRYTNYYNTEKIPY